MSQRLDKWLVYSRLVKHRSAASALIAAGHVRVNRIRVGKVSHAVKESDVLTIIFGSRVRVVRVLGEAERRGRARDAMLLYEALDDPQKQGADAEATC